MGDLVGGFEVGPGCDPFPSSNTWHPQGGFVRTFLPTMIKISLRRRSFHPVEKLSARTQSGSPGSYTRPAIPIDRWCDGTDPFLTVRAPQLLRHGLTGAVWKVVVLFLENLPFRVRFGLERFSDSCRKRMRSDRYGALYTPGWECWKCYTEGASENVLSG